MPSPDLIEAVILIALAIWNACKQSSQPTSLRVRIKIKVEVKIRRGS